MTYVVVAMPAPDFDAFGRVFLPHTEVMMRGAGWVYLCYTTATLVETVSFFDGETPLVMMRAFDSLKAAQSWSENDARERLGGFSSERRAQ